MPRIGRVHSGTGIYHVMLRGINRQDVFEDAEDYWTFIRIESGIKGTGSLQAKRAELERLIPPSIHKAVSLWWGCFSLAKIWKFRK